MRHGLAAGLSDGGADPPMLLSSDDCVASCCAMTCTPPRQLTGDTRPNTTFACSSTISPDTGFGAGLATSAQCWYDRTISSGKSMHGRAHTPAVGAALNELAPAAESPLHRGIHLGESAVPGFWHEARGKH